MAEVEEGNGDENMKIIAKGYMRDLMIIFEMNQAALYSSASGLQRKDAADVLDEYIARLNWASGDTVLDVGCGSGDVTASLLLPGIPQTCQRLLGVDVSHEMIQYATCTHQYPRLHFIQADIAMEHLKTSELWREAGGGFHKIFSFFCLHWVQEQRRALRNIHALLRKHGEALLVFLASCPIYTMYEALAKKPEWKEYMQDVSRFVSPYQHSEDPAKEFGSLLQDVGFTSVDCKIRQSCHEFDSTDNLTESLKAVNPFLDRVPLNRQADFLMDCLYEIHKLKLATGVEPNNNNEPVSRKIIARYNLLIAHVKK